MRSVTYSMSVSLDGYIVGPDGGFHWTTPDKAAASSFRRARQPAHERKRAGRSRQLRWHGSENLPTVLTHKSADGA